MLQNPPKQVGESLLLDRDLRLLVSDDETVTVHHELLSKRVEIGRRHSARKGERSDVTSL